MRVSYGIAGVVVIAGLASAAHAGNCLPTPRLPTAAYPGAAQVGFGNNLLAPAGKAVEATGQKLTIYGRVVDNNCVPVANATVELWQANPFGRYAIATPAERVTSGPTFTGAGRATTDNDGNFYFITAFPAPVGKNAPQVNVKVMAEGMADFSTVLYFGGDQRNSSDTTLNKNVARSAVTIDMRPPGPEGLQGTIQLVLAQKAPYRIY